MYCTSAMKTILLLCVLVVFDSLSSSAFGYSINPRESHPTTNNDSFYQDSGREQSRRSMISHLLSPSLFLLASSAAGVPSTTTTANAFDNKLPGAVATTTPQVGEQPQDLGVASRFSRTVGSYTGLKPCGNSPNCWCSSAPFADNPARYLAPWKGSSIKDVKQVIDTYKVGQQGIDGGGFSIIQYDEKEQYIYVQFQSFKAGYVDDLEIWYNPQIKAYDVRSSSRLGYSDLGVNAKRLEYIGDRLEQEYGWTLERRKSGSLV